MSYFNKNSILNFAISATTLSLLTFCAYIYSNSYALHQIAAVSYVEFDTIPTSRGRVEYTSRGIAIDFNLPNLTLSDTTIDEIRRSIGNEEANDFELMTRCVELVRTRLNATDAKKPNAATANSEKLYRDGNDLFCLCSEHAILLNEILQLFEIPSRVLWLEGHVATEYYDSSSEKWVFIDPHMNVIFSDSMGSPLSIAELIRSTEEDRNVTLAPICTEIENSHSLQHDDIDQLWYRNILLNGECYALSGTTLLDPVRWTHLAKYHQFPQMLVLVTNHDTTHAKYIEPFRPHKCLLLCCVFIGAHNLLLLIPHVRKKLRWNSHTTT